MTQDRPVKISEVVDYNTQITFRREDMQEAMNMHWLGQTNCNVFDPVKNQLVGVEHPNKALLEKAQYNFSPCNRKAVMADLMSDGSLQNFRFVTDKELAAFHKRQKKMKQTWSSKL